MKEGRRLGGVHAGPESKVLSKQSKEERKSEQNKRGKREKRTIFKVLDGLSWEEVKNMQDAAPSQVDGYGGMKVDFFSYSDSSLPHIPHIHLDFDFTQTRVMVKESVWKVFPNKA